MRKTFARIVFGLAMIAGTAGVLLLDWTVEGLIYVIRLGGLPVTALFLVLVVLGFLELKRLAAAGGVRLLTVSGLVGAAVVATMPYWWWSIVQPRMTGTGVFPHAMTTVLAVLWLIFAEQMIRFGAQDALRRVAATVLAVAYLGLGGAAVLWLRVDDRGSVQLLVLFLAAVKCTDIGAYLVGSAIGRHKMIPWLSPGKSWEGLVGGLAAGAGAAMLAAKLLNLHGLSPAEAACFGAIVGAAGQFADLCESLLKRSVNAKDSGALVPQFGGVLDIVDSPLLAAPVAVVLQAVFL